MLSSSTALAPVNALLARCQEVRLALTDVDQYSKLEKIEIGGAHGAALTASARQLHAEFSALHRRLTYDLGDPLDFNAASYFPAMAAWQQALSHLDGRLGRLVAHAVGAAPTHDAVARSLEVFGELAYRTAAQTQVQKACKAALGASTGVAAPPAVGTHALFGRHGGEHGLESCADELLRLRLAQERLRGPIDGIKPLPTSTPAYRAASGASGKTFDAPLAALAAEETAVMQHWCRSAATLTEQVLERSVLAMTGNKNATCVVNFDPSIHQFLKVVRLLLAMPRLPCPLPPSVMRLYLHESTLTANIAVLSNLADDVNRSRTQLLPEEVELLAGDIAGAEAAVERGLQHIRWSSPELPAFVALVSECCSKLHAGLHALQGIKAAVDAQVKQWQKVMPLPIQALSTGKVAAAPMTPAAFQGWLTAAIAQRKDALLHSHTQLSAELSAAAQSMGVHISAPAWQGYCAHVASLVHAGVQEAVAVSLDDAGHVFGQIQDAGVPLLTVELHVVPGSGLEWMPLLDERATAESAQGGKNVAEMLQTYIQAIGKLEAMTLDFSERQMASVSASSAKQPGGRIANAHSSSTEAIAASLQQCRAKVAILDKFKELWEGDSQASAHIAKGAPIDETRLKSIEFRVERLRSMHAEVGTLPSTLTAGWIQINLEPAKQALMGQAKKEIGAATDAVRNHVQQSVTDLQKFMQGAKSMLDTGIQWVTGSASSKKVGPSPRASAVKASGVGRPSRLASVASVKAGVPPSKAMLVNDQGGAGRAPPANIADVQGDASNRSGLHSILQCICAIHERSSKLEAEMQPLRAASAALERCGAPLPHEVAAQIAGATEVFATIFEAAKSM